jgi:hypothetical protein
VSPLLALAIGTAAALPGGGGPGVALSVSPARLALVAPASRTLELRNGGSEQVVVEVARKSVDGRTAKGWLIIRPARIVLRAGSTAAVTIRATARAAQAGDHRLLVLLIARPVQRGRVAVRVRLGVGLRIRVPGRIVRRLELRGLRVRPHGRVRDLLVTVTNRGNVTEQLRGQLTVSLARDGRIVSRLRPRRLRELLPGTQTVLALRYAGRLRGRVSAIVRVRLGAHRRALERRYRIRL